ncbi:MAG: CRTAC1 family protein, partial [Planctomycetales bacterium]|nr:CRTAC1 family protein [Planctomycetales bacterium]
MTVHSRRAMVTCAFVGLLMGPTLYFRVASLESDSINKSNVEHQQRLLARYGFQLTEAAQVSGVTFVHHPPAIDPRLDPIGPQVAAMGASVAVVDFDRDGWQDFYVTDSARGTQNCLYRNLRNGTFTNVAKELGFLVDNDAIKGACQGSAWADINNDGFEDVIVYRWGKSELWLNHGGQQFEFVAESGLPAWANIGCATWLDYDRDGLIDLFLAGYWPDDVHLENLADTRIMPESFEYANNGGRKWLLRNTGESRFEDVTEQLGISSTRWTLAVVAADFNHDLYPDLFLSNDYGISELYINMQGTAFREQGKDSGIGYAPKSGMNAAVGDVLNQGRLAIYESNISEEGVLLQGNNLWVPTGDKALQFDNLASVMGVELGGWSFGAQFGDLNNDGNLDLYLTNGYVSGEEGTSYWYDFSQITGGHSQIISDARNWPAMRGRSLAGHQTKRVWLSDGAGAFHDVAQFVGVNDRLDGRAVALADLSNHGALDILVANQRGPLLIYRNTVAEDRHWIDFELTGTQSNRSAIGAQVRVFWDGQQQLQELVAASGYAAQNQRRLHFGLGQLPKVDRVEIHWPSGIVQTLESPAVDQVHRVE